jgi:hypothetical protein
MRQSWHRHLADEFRTSAGSRCHFPEAWHSGNVSYGHSMQKAVIIVLGILPLAFAFAEPIIPIVPGTTWQYTMTQEAGAGLRFSDAKPDADGKVRLAVIYRIAGTENIDGQDLLKFEMHRAGMITNTDLVTVNEHGITCLARIDQADEMTKLDPPQIMIAAPLKKGTTWDFDGDVAGAKVHQHYEVTAEEDVAVPAGKFRAFRIHADQTGSTPLVIDRWFVNDVGIVKDITTTYAPRGDLRRRITLELKERPKIMARPEVKPVEPQKKLTAMLAKDPLGRATTNFTTGTPKIYARWQGNGLHDQATIRAVWIAENIEGVAPPDYTIDEATAVATAPDAHGIFTLSRPDEGWAPGDYRADFYVDAELVETVKMKISK